MERKSNYKLQDFYDILKEAFPEPVEVDLVRNQLGQDSVRVHHRIDRLREFDMFIFGSDFAVAYKPNGRVKLYESITPNQARKIAKASIDWWLRK